MQIQQATVTTVECPNALICIPAEVKTTSLIG